MRAVWFAGTAIIFTALTAGPPELASVVTLEQRDVGRSPLGEPSADISADGRYVAFASSARLVEADRDEAGDIYVLDRITGRVTLETRESASGAAYSAPRISGDGRYVVYQQITTRSDIVVSDRQASQTVVVTAGFNGAPFENLSRHPDISDDGRLLVFTASASDLERADSKESVENVYAVDVAEALRGGPIRARRISLDDRGTQAGSGSSYSPAVSGDGRRVVFTSSAALDSRVSARRGTTSRRSSANPQVFLRDLDSGSTTQVSRGPHGEAPDRSSWSGAISADGRHVAFVSTATNLVSDDRNRLPDVFLADLQSGSILRVSRTQAARDANGASLRPAISADGRFVAFQSDASNLTCDRRCPEGFEDLNLLWDIFLFDRLRATIARLSEDATGGWMEPSVGPRISANGDVLVFSSRQPTDASDRRNDFDLFVRARSPATLTAVPRGARTESR